MNQQIILLTGGSSGIGLEAAKQLMEKGACVYSASRRAAESMHAKDGSGIIITKQVDINNAEAITNLVDEIVHTHQRLDAVICNAGNGIAGAVEEHSEEEVRYQMETNFFGAVKTIQACLPTMRRQGFGKIMVTSSVAAIVPIPYQALYSAGKAAILMFTQALSIEVKLFNIQCSVVLPGDTKTGFTSARKYTESALNNTSPYYTRMQKSVGKMTKDEENGMEASFVAKAMVKQVLKKNMKPVIIPGMQYKLICCLFHIIPVKLRLSIISSLY